MEKIINYDMDGTIADLYGVENWLDDLINENVRPYEIARPMLNLSLMARYIHKLQLKGFEFNIISWTSKNGSDEYNERVANAKIEWLKRHLPSVEWTHIYIIPYGTPKNEFSSGILFDDEEHNRAEWGKNSYNNTEIIQILKQLYLSGDDV